MEEIRELKGIRIKTPNGFKDISKIKRIRKNGYFQITLDNGSSFGASGSHRILVVDGHFQYVSQLCEGSQLQLQDGNIGTVEKVEWIEDTIYLYDLIDVDGEIYCTENGIISHNCAFIDNVEETFAAAQQTLATGGQAMLLSTPNGIGNFFHKMWVKAESGENSFVPVKLPWQVHPERDQAWRDKQDADLGLKFAAQECVAGDTRITLRNTETGEIVETSIEEAYTFI